MPEARHFFGFERGIHGRRPTVCSQLHDELPLRGGVRDIGYCKRNQHGRSNGIEYATKFCLIGSVLVRKQSARYPSSERRISHPLRTSAVTTRLKKEMRPWMPLEPP